MFDIISFECNANPKEFGFEKFFFFEQVKSKIAICEDVVNAEKYKNQKILILLKDPIFDEGVIKLIGEKKKACFLIDVGALIRTRGVGRAILISKIRNFLCLCNKHGAFYAFASFAQREEAIRNADELINLSLLFDINCGQAKFAMKMLTHYL